MIVSRGSIVDVAATSCPRSAAAAHHSAVYEARSCSAAYACGGKYQVHTPYGIGILVRLLEALAKAMVVAQ